MKMRSPDANSDELQYHGKRQFFKYSCIDEYSQGLHRPRRLRPGRRYASQGEAFPIERVLWRQRNSCSALSRVPRLVSPLPPGWPSQTAALSSSTFGVCNEKRRPRAS